MQASRAQRLDTQQKTVVGFLTVVDDAQHGLCGGYLILNRAARPLEFHCTVPIKANRAQEILYGPTLQAFLYGEQIGQTLLGKAKCEPLVVCTDCRPVLAVGEFTSTPVVLVLNRNSDGEKPAGDYPLFRTDGPHSLGTDLAAFSIGKNRLAIEKRRQSQGETLAQQAGEILETFDLAEPFERIREAIAEAQKAAR
jgi:hypothetical protein